MGESGSGKSASLRNFEPEEVSVFNVAAKPMPFRKRLPTKATANYGVIMGGIKASQKKNFVIDDSQFLMCFESFAKAKDTVLKKLHEMNMPCVEDFLKEFMPGFEATLDELNQK